MVRRLEAHVELIPICPEVAVGLGAPRSPIRLVGNRGGTVLIQPTTGRDLTEPMHCQRPSKAAQVWPSKIAHLAEVTSLWFVVFSFALALFLFGGEGLDSAGGEWRILERSVCLRIR